MKSFLLAGVAGCTLLGAGCAGPAASSGAAQDGRLAVSAAFYPLQYAAERVGGTHVTVTGLTKPGVEPHDLELTPREVADLRSAALVFYESSLQPAVDDATQILDPGVAYDVAGDARLLPADHAAHAEETEHSPETETEEPETGHAEGTEDPDHDGDSHAEDGDGHDHGGVDPHFWLDPTRLADVGVAMAAALAEKDPAHAADYRRNATDLAEELHALDREYRDRLAGCQVRELVTSHAAFGYLADRYGFTHHAIAGLSPEDEPSAGTMKEIVDFLAEHRVPTVYTETLANPIVAETVAKEAGAATAVLDPVEGVTEASTGDTYPDIMRGNLETLVRGQACG